MINYLRGAIPWLIRRGELLQKRLEGINIPASVKVRLSKEISELESTITDAYLLLTDPTLNDVQYMDQNLITFRQWVRTVDDIEAIFLPLTERWGPDEDEMQDLLIRICKETNLPPTVQPIIALYSSEYFSVLEHLHVIYMPRLEGKFLLHLPDLYHEVGHVLLEQKAQLLWQSFEDEIRQHFDRMHLKGKLANDPLAANRTYLDLADSWVQRWIIEFTCDIFAAYSCGPAYGWSHLHLCASKGSSIYTIEPDSHPADNARLQLILQVLEEMGWSPVVKEIQVRWRSLLRSLGEKEPTNYPVAYPENLLRGLREQVKRGLLDLNVPLYSPASSRQSRNLLADLLNQAWNTFWGSPHTYAGWEERTLYK